MMVRFRPLCGLTETPAQVRMSWACCSTSTVMFFTSPHHESKRSFMPLIWNRDQHFIVFLFFFYLVGNMLVILGRRVPTCCRSRTLGCTQVICTFWSTSSMFPFIRPTESAFITSSSTCRTQTRQPPPAVNAAASGNVRRRGSPRWRGSWRSERSLWRWAAGGWRDGWTSSGKPRRKPSEPREEIRFGKQEENPPPSRRAAGSSASV